MLGSLARADLDLPGDLSFVTYGDSAWAGVYRPPIAVVRRDLYGEARHLTAEVLHGLGAAPEPGPPDVRPPEFLARGSIGPARAGSDDAPAGPGR